MKKIIYYLLLIIIPFVAFSCNYYQKFDKVIYETKNNYKMMSLNQLDDYQLSTLNNNSVVLKTIVKYNDDHYKIIDDLKAPIYELYDDNNLTEEKINKAKAQVREQLRKYHSSFNKQISNNIGLSNYESVFVSEYGPYIEYTYKGTEFIKSQNQILSTLSKNCGVTNVYVADLVEYTEEQLVDTMGYAGVLPIYQNRTYTGSGIKVGILESGIVDKNSSLLSNTDIIIRTQLLPLNRVSEHTTYMGSIIAGNQGIAPNATILSTYLKANMASQVEWMLDKDVDVINLSISEVDDDGNVVGDYSSMSAYIDYIAHTYDVIMVAAAGNFGGETLPYISNPGLGKNVITVGSTADNAPAPTPFTSHLVKSNIFDKPTLSINGILVDIPGTNIYTQGTSISCAMVSGIVALLLEQYPIYKTRPSELIALLTANSTRSTLEGCYYALNEPLNEYIGAGILTLQNLFNHDYDLAGFTYNPRGTADNYVFSTYVTVEAGDYIRAAISWYAKSTGNADSTVIGDYDIELIKDDELVWGSASSNSTVEVLEHQVTTAGTYMILITRYEESVFDRDTIGYYIWTGDPFDFATIAH